MNTTTSAIVNGTAPIELTVEFVLDSGVKYSVLPDHVWRQLGLVPKRTMRFGLADGTLIEREVGDCHFRLGDIDHSSPAILGLPGDTPILGEVTLSTLGLVFNPFTRQMQPMTLRL